MSDTAPLARRRTSIRCKIPHDSREGVNLNGPRRAEPGGAGEFGVLVATPYPALKLLRNERIMMTGASARNQHTETWEVTFCRLLSERTSLLTEGRQSLYAKQRTVIQSFIGYSLDAFFLWPMRCWQRQASHGIS